MSDQNPEHRRIKSYVLRGKKTASQQRNHEQFWPKYGLDVEQGLLDTQSQFKRTAPVILEIGFGMGDSLAQMVAHNPEQDFIGVEVHAPGVGRILGEVGQQQLSNFAVYQHDAIEVLERCIADASLKRVQLFFPDPWHKARHHKRRIVQQEFINLVAKKLTPGGVFHMATDWENYAEHMLAEMQKNSAFSNQAGEQQYAKRPAYRPETKFERRGQNLGHGVWDLLFEKVSTDE